MANSSVGRVVKPEVAIADANSSVLERWGILITANLGVSEDIPWVAIGASVVRGAAAADTTGKAFLNFNKKYLRVQIKLLLKKPGRH